MKKIAQKLVENCENVNICHKSAKKRQLQKSNFFRKSGVETVKTRSNALKLLNMFNCAFIYCQ